MLDQVSGNFNYTKISGNAIFDSRIIDHIDLNIFEPTYWAAHGASQVAGGRGKVLFIDGAECHWVLRHYRRGGLVGKIIADRYLWSGAERTRAFREWGLLAQLYAQGLPVPQPVAAHYQRQGFSYRADLITVAIQQARTLTQRLETEALSETVWCQIGEVIARFHAAGVKHADLNAHNIVFDARQTVYLLDFDRGQVRDVNPVWIEAVLQRLLRSLNTIAVYSSFDHDEGWNIEPSFFGFHRSMANE